jgi:hypothetical protein
VVIPYYLWVDEYRINVFIMILQQLPQFHIKNKNPTCPSMPPAGSCELRQELHLKFNFFLKSCKVEKLQELGVQKRVGNTKVANNQNTAFAPKDRNKAPKEAHRIKGKVGVKASVLRLTNFWDWDEV